MSDELKWLMAIVISLFLVLSFAMLCFQLGTRSFRDELRQSGISIERVWPAEGTPYWRIVATPEAR